MYKVWQSQIDNWIRPLPPPTCDDVLSVEINVMCFLSGWMLDSISPLLLLNCWVDLIVG